MKQRIIQKTEAISDEVIAIRRHLHQHPELSFREFETSAFICKKLAEWGIPFKHGIVKTGVVAFVQSPKAGARCIALRADMDALPIQELNEVPYRSQNTGVMHACGHDVHTSVLLGTAKILNEFKDELPFSVKLIFQPGEEKLPGGARLMIEEGVLENPRVEEIYALHVFPELEAGKVGLRSGMYMASCDELYFTVIGKGGHAAMPKLNVDPVMMAARLVIALQQIPDQLCPENIPCVLAIGRIEGLGATNVIPDQVEMQGTFRTMNEEWRQRAHGLIRETAARIAAESGGKIEVRIEKGYPFLENHPQLTERTRQVLESAFGKDQVIDLPLRMTGEDFAFYGQQVPATFIRLGVRNESKGITHAVHNARFDIDETALQQGIRTFLNICFRAG
jgi:amidohydrolase